MALGLASAGLGLAQYALHRKLEIRAFADEFRTQQLKGKGFRAQINPASLQIFYRNDLTGEAGLNSAGASLAVSGSEPEIIKFKLILTDSSIFHFSSTNNLNLTNQYFEDKNVFRDLQDATHSFDTNKKVVKDAQEIAKGKDFEDKVLVHKRDKGSVAEGIEKFLNLTTQDILKKENENEHVFLGLKWGSMFYRPDNNNLRQNIYPVYLESVDVNYTQFSQDGLPLRAELDCVFREDSTDEVLLGG